MIAPLPEKIDQAPVPEVAELAESVTVLPLQTLVVVATLALATVGFAFTVIVLVAVPLAQPAVPATV